MNRKEREEYLALLEEKERRRKTRKLYTYYPETGPLRRELYPKHMEFFKAGKDYRERLFLAANRVGKTEGAGGLELTYHLTGLYPEWWEGKRFDRPVEAWVAGKSGTTTRDIIQNKLFGGKETFGQGLIPLSTIIGKPTAKAGLPDAFDTAHIKHVSGGTSVLQFKAFEQGRTAFEGTEKDIIWLDEEVPLDVYTECLLRTADTTGTGEKSGLIIVTFTPLKGLTETVLAFLPNGDYEDLKHGSKYIVMASWDDVPHLTEETKKELLASIPPFQRDARSKGIPQLGAGAIYPVPESEVFIDDFAIPDHWPRAYGLDVGWNKTAAPWGAWDRENDTLYVYAEHYRGQAEPDIHASAIKAKGDWIEGVIDPASRGRSQIDGKKLIQSYRELGLKLGMAFNGVESGIHEVWQRLVTGRLKIFKSCNSLKQEYRLYRRDEKGHIVKENDHLMDALRYLVMSGLAVAKTKPVQKIQGSSQSSGPNSWLG